MTIKKLLLATLFLALLGQLSAADAQEWTRFRGPNGSGASEASTVPDTWSDNDYNWKVELPGAGHSSPVLWGNKIFLINGDPATGNRIVMCLNAADGSIAWKKQYAGSLFRIHQFSSFASSTPATDKNHVYVAWATPEKYTLMALDHDGNEVWQRDLGPFKSQHGQGTSPILYDDLVIIGDEHDAPGEITPSGPAIKNDPDAEAGKSGGSWLMAFDRNTGDLRWKIPRKSLIVAYSTPCVYHGASGRDELIFDGAAHGMTSIDPQTGKVNWELPVFERRCVGSPVVVGDLVLGTCGNGAGINTLVAIRPGDGKDIKPEIAYKIDKTSAPYVPTVIAKGDLVFLWSDQGIATCIDGPSGKIHWRERIGGSYFGSPVRVANRIYCTSTDGEVVVLAASDQFQVISRAKLDDVCRSTPAVAGGKLYLRTQSHLFSLGGKAATQ